MDNKKYHCFLFLTNLSRGIVETFSLVLLYKKGFSANEILSFLGFIYFFGIFVNYISLKINYKIVLIVSSLLYGCSYLYLTVMNNSFICLILFGLLLSVSTYSYHCIRHYLALGCNETNTSFLINIMFLATIFSSIVGTYIVSNLSIYIISIILIVLSVISLIPIFKMKININKKRKKVIIDKRKILFNIFEQFKVIFLELQPFFLYVYISDSIFFVGWFNIIINISALIFLYFSRKIDVYKYYLYICLFLGLVLLLKISISNYIVLFIIAFFEGVLVKLYERGSLSKLYDYGSNSFREYLLVEELIFFISKTILILIFLLLNINLKSILFICIIGIMISGFVFSERCS